MLLVAMKHISGETSQGSCVDSSSECSEPFSKRPFVGRREHRLPQGRVLQHKIRC